ncbi:MAG TPA: hypothetical protein VNB03_15530 [Casimicrobiaceae bacterium]|nr:hypothetical protein [Casimicrobiaceae bacterium]
MASAVTDACVCALALLLALAAPDATSAPAQDQAAIRAEREAIRQRAERARAALAAAETQRQDATQAIAAADRALSEARARQVEAEAAREAAAAAQRSAQAAAHEAAKGLRADQSRLARLVALRHAGGEAEPLKLWLSGRDPSDIARLSAWLDAVGRARLEAIERWRRDRERQASLAAAADVTRRAFDDSARDVARHAASVDARRREQAAVLARVSVDIRRQRASSRAIARCSSVSRGPRRGPRRAPCCRTRCHPRHRHEVSAPCAASRFPSGGNSPAGSGDQGRARERRGADGSSPLPQARRSGPSPQVRWFGPTG